MQRTNAIPVALEREVVVLSNDGAVRGEVNAVVAQRPWARATFAGPLDLPPPARGGQIVVIDDEGHADAVEIIHRLKADRGEPAVVYLATNHSAALEGAVRRAGASFYAVKSARDGDLARVIEALLARPKS